MEVNTTLNRLLKLEALLRELPDKTFLDNKLTEAESEHALQEAFGIDYDDTIFLVGEMFEHQAPKKAADAVLKVVKRIAIQHEYEIVEE